jgi:hypothetical protein
MSDVTAAANPIKLPKSCRMEAFAAPMNQAAKPEGETTIFYHQAEKSRCWERIRNFLHSITFSLSRK